MHEKNKYALITEIYFLNIILLKYLCFVGIVLIYKEKMGIN